MSDTKTILQMAERIHELQKKNRLLESITPVNWLENQQKLDAVRDYFEDHCIKCDAEDCFGCSFDHIKRLAGIPSKFAQKEETV